MGVRRWDSDLGAPEPRRGYALRRMRVLVTGGHGFIGSHLVRRLLAGGAAVRCLSRRPGIPPALEGLDVEVVAGDLRHAGGLARALEGVDEVHHLAGLTSSLTRHAMLATNAEGTRRLLEAAETAGLAGRFVLCSSSSVTGPVPPGARADATTPCRPLTWYAESKLAAEAHTRARAAQVPITILRPPGVYGPRDEAFLPLFRSAARGVSLLAGHPSKAYSLVFAEDLAAAFVAAARSPATEGGTFFVAHPELVTLGRLVEAAEAAVARRTRRVRLPESLMRLIGSLVDLGAQWTGRPSVLGSQRMREVATGDWTCDPTDFMAATGWEPALDVVAGFARTAAWYRSAGWIR